jgi:hypothetical protein
MCRPAAAFSDGHHNSSSQADKKAPHPLLMPRIVPTLRASRPTFRANNLPFRAGIRPSVRLKPVSCGRFVVPCGEFPFRARDSAFRAGNRYFVRPLFNPCGLCKGLGDQYAIIAAFSARSPAPSVRNPCRCPPHSRFSSVGAAYPANADAAPMELETIFSALLQRFRTDGALKLPHAVGIFRGRLRAVPQARAAVDAFSQSWF